MAYIVYCQKTIGFVKDWKPYKECPTLREAEYTMGEAEAKENGYAYKVEAKPVTS